MEVRSCKGCGRLFNYISGSSYTNLCPACIDALEEKFTIAKKYIEENKGAKIEEIAEVADVKPQQIERWVREERLYFAEDSAIGISCAKCGRMIKSGNFCPACKEDMAATLGSAYGNPGIVKRKELRKVANARMRFLDNN